MHSSDSPKFVSASAPDLCLSCHTSHKEGRANAKTVLLEAAQFMERYRTINFKYVDAANVVPALPANLQVSPQQGDKRYDITVVANATSFTLTATPSGWADSLCGTLTIDSLGAKGQSAGTAATCWNR